MNSHKNDDDEEEEGFISVLSLKKGGFLWLCWYCWWWWWWLWGGEGFYLCVIFEEGRDTLGSGSAQGTDATLHEACENDDNDDEDDNDDYEDDDDAENDD